MSGSLFFGTKVLKQDVVAQIVSLLGLSTVKNSDSFTLSMFSDRLLDKSIPTKKETGIIRAVEKVLNYKVIGEHIDYEALYEYVLHKIKKRSLIFLIGDFTQLPKLKALSKKHEIIVVKVRDSFELNPNALGDIGIIDPSNYKKVEISLNQNSIKKYKQELKKADLKFGEYLRNSNIKLIDILTNENIYQKFSSFFRGN